MMAYVLAILIIIGFLLMRYISLRSSFWAVVFFVVYSIFFITIDEYYVSYMIDNNSIFIYACIEKKSSARNGPFVIVKDGNKSIKMPLRHYSGGIYSVGKCYNIQYVDVLGTNYLINVYE